MLGYSYNNLLIHQTNLCHLTERSNSLFETTSIHIYSKINYHEIEHVWITKAMMPTNLLRRIDLCLENN